MTTDPSTPDLPEYDAQRDLEHKALRNVRGLVDRMEADEQSRRKLQNRVLAVIAVAVVSAGAIVAATVMKDRGAGHEVTVAPVTKPAAR